MWALLDTKKLGNKATEILLDRKNRCFLSIASIWEISVKQRIGKLEFKDFKLDDVKKYCKLLGIDLLPITVGDTVQNAKIPFKLDHRDPFDRILIATAIRKGFTILSKDGKFELYKQDGLRVLW